MGEQLGRAVATLRWSPIPRSLTVAQGEVSGGQDQADSDVRYLGAESGLRGFPSREFAAQNFVFATLEQRLWSGMEIMWFGLGANLFTDTVRATMDGRFDDEPWRTGWGFGLLLGSRKSAQQPVRIEVAWRTDRRASPTFSITAGSRLRIVPPVGMPYPIGDLRDGLR